MKWSYKIARIAGIDVSVHITFFLLLLWFAVASWQQSGELSAVLTSLAFILVLFACVVMHEYGHALTARRFGIKTRGITLLPIGGVASLEKMPDDPKQEILVALAGPAVNVVIASALYLYLSVTAGMPDSPEAAGDLGAAFLFNIMVINIILGVFNLLPAFPMDGGRVLRASLALAMPHNEATQRAARIGQTFAVLLALMGIFFNPWLILIAAFIWIAASAEANMEQVHTDLMNITAGQAMITDYHSLDIDDNLQKAIDLTLQTSQKDYPVTVNGMPRYVLSQADLLSALQHHSRQQHLADLQLPEITLVDAGEQIEDLFRRLSESRQPLVAVRHGSGMAGIINLDNIMELMRIDRAVKSRHAQKRLSM